jgi:alpha-glucosidase
MHNAQQANYATFMERPMSMGTRCQQLAMYVVYEGPLQMLSDAPTAYLKEPESLEFIADVPTTWDETKALSGKIGEYVAIARKKGDDWYIGAMTNWSERDMTIDFSFLSDGNYTAEVFKDGINANRYGNDYMKETIRVDSNSKLKFHMSPGGGLAIKLIPER